MPKEIKFRGKCIYPGRDGVEIFNKFIYGDLHKRGNEWFIYCNDLWFEVDKETVGQYTGLKDKNGKEIYEGDIIKYSHKAVGEIKREVRYKYGMYGIEGRHEGTQIPFANILGSEREVVGNIYENPELLEGN